MVFWIMPPRGIIEPVPVPEFFIDDVGAIEMIGACIRMYYCTRQMPLECAGAEPQRIVTLKLVRPICTVPGAIAGLVQCLNAERSPDIHYKGPWQPHVVR